MKLSGALFALLLIPAITNAECPLSENIVDVNGDGRLTILAFGDSITRGAGAPKGEDYPTKLARLLPGATVYNYGARGETTQKAKRRLKKLIRQHKGDIDFIIIMEGLNDYWFKPRSLRRTHRNLRTLLSYGAKMGAVPLLGSITPIVPKNQLRAGQAVWAEQLNRQIRRDVDIDFRIDTSGLSADGVHPNPDGYEEMAERALLDCILGGKSKEQLELQ